MEPRLAGHGIADEAAAGAREQALVGELQVVKVDGLGAVGAVDVAEDVEAGPDAPDLAEQVGAAVALPRSRWCFCATSAC